MPYIKKEDRERIDPILEKLLPEITGPGDLNYAITALIHDIVAHKGQSYTLYNELIGVLECAKLELYRRKVSRYEDHKILENGDV